jgi:hypothetical protein
MKTITESLRANDLRHMVKPIFEIDSYRSKIGDDDSVIVLSFTVDYEDPAKDLENFIEMGYEYVLDADVTSGETDDGTYKVFVEIERGRRAIEQIVEILEGVKKLAGISTFRFRYFKSFKSKDATEENLAVAVPVDKNSYEIATSRNVLENFSNFFSNSYLEDVQLLDESIKFKKIWKDPIEFKIITSGPKSVVYESIDGPIKLSGSDMAEVMFFTKYIGNYNITKIGNSYIFENNGWAVAMEKK